MSDAMFDGAIAIDIGTTYSRVAVWEGGGVTVIPDKYGNHNIPSCVAFTDSDDFFVGQDAVNQADANLENTVFAIKKLLGVSPQHWSAEEVKKQFPFSIASGGNDMVTIYLEQGDTTHEWPPEGIAARLLYELKEMAETYLGKTVTKAVLTVPSLFCQTRRRALLDAATIAGLEVLQLIDDTVAAGVMYRMKNIFRNGETRNVILVECGSFYFHISCMEVGRDTMNVKHTEWCLMSGEDVTDCLVEHCAAEFERNNNGKDVLQDSHAKHRLRVACEQAKTRLSQTEATIQLDNLMDGVAFKTTISRDSFKKMCERTCFFKDKIISMKKYVNANKLNVHDVVLLGGSTRIPKIQQLCGVFADDDDEKPTATPNSDDAYVYGAAVHAFILSGGESVKTEYFPLINVMTRDLILHDPTKTISKVVVGTGEALPAEKSFSLDELRSEGFNEGIIDWYHTLDFLGTSRQFGNARSAVVTFCVDTSGVFTVWAAESDTSKRIRLDANYGCNLRPKAVTNMTANMMADGEKRKKKKTRPLQQTAPPPATTMPYQYPPPTPATTMPFQYPPPTPATTMPFQYQSLNFSNPPPTPATTMPFQYQSLNFSNPPPTPATTMPFQYPSLNFSNPPPTPATTMPFQDALHDLTTTVQTHKAEILRLTNVNKELVERIDAMQRDHAMYRQMEIARAECIVAKVLILNKESDQREQRSAEESSLRQQLTATSQAHLQWANDRVARRQRIEAQETMQRALLQNAFGLKLATARQMGKSRFAIAQQEQMEQLKVRRHESRRQSNAIETLRHTAARDALEKYALRMLIKIRDASATSGLQKSSEAQIASAVDSALDWLASNPEATLAECEQHLSALRNICACSEAPTPRSTYSSVEWDEHYESDVKQ